MDQVRSGPLEVFEAQGPVLRALERRITVLGSTADMRLSRRSGIQPGLLSVSYTRRFHASASYGFEKDTIWGSKLSCPYYLLFGQRIRALI